MTNILKETRSEILKHLKKGRRLTVGELASFVGVSKVSIRRHLDLLQKDGLVDFEKQQKERGRPGHVYHLTEKADIIFPKSYNRLALGILKQVKTLFGESGVSKVFCKHADELASFLLTEIEEQDFDSQVKKISLIMNDRGYDVTLVRLQNDSYLLRQCNCPMEAVATNYDQVCAEELRVYREVLRTEVSRKCRIAGGAQSCDYMICRPSSKPEVKNLLETKKGKARRPIDG